MSLLVRHCNKLLLVCRDSSTSLLPSTYFAARSASTTFVPTVFDAEDPAPKFFSPKVQLILKRLTRPDFAKVFRKRATVKSPFYNVKTPAFKIEKLNAPEYKFLTSEQLEKEVAKAQKKADKLLQTPPIVMIRKPVDKVLSRDPGLTAFSSGKYVFTDISFGLTNESRIIVERDIDGTLRYVDHDTKKRVNQAYFPIMGRSIKDPPMFTQEEKLYSLLDRGHYEFVLDRACIQYEPDDPQFQRICSITFQHIDMRRNYSVLRSTRHFGALAFYLAWHHSIDGLLLELLQTGHIRDAACLIALRHHIHANIAHGDEAVAISEKVQPTPAQPPTYENMTEEDVQLDLKCVECVTRYISNNSAMKSYQELALQSFRETHQQQIELSRGLRKAHGTS